MKLDFPNVGETIHHVVLDNGLTVYLLKKAGYEKTYATFTTKYGSIDRRFKTDDWIEVPDGIAHFLEHKMFEKEDGDVFQKFGQLGASANAFTSFTRTAYLFGATSNVEANLKTLIDFVQDPYFTEASVEKEKGIIGQEIQMYQDNAGWRLYFGLIEAMYEAHPVKIDIAGTIESISAITAADLYACHQAFYHPSNMTLFVVGNIDPDIVLEQIRSNQAAKTFEPPVLTEREHVQEPRTVRLATRVIEMDVSVPKVMIGYKDTPRAGEDGMKQELAVELLMHALFDTTAPLYAELYAEGLIDDAFSFDYTSEESFAFAVLSMETPHVDAFVARITEVLERPLDIGNETLDRKKRMMKGQFLKALNSPEFIANQFSRYALTGGNMFDLPELLDAVTLEELYDTYDRLFKPDQRTVCVVKKP
ncbi:zinc protease [Exiguobacterium sp. SH31]|uniref:EF-P 5-aminopentanol modification-associated protein YfmH n=1 Tax=unclassified Exiguobacterium TaxID=2644629 RepID=UPI0008AD21CC|nr:MULTISPECIES: pitrilysin family protein [unclassified Exiguobacterium]OGX80359.1 zinc protease [Exiguobacterium sp. SH31]TCI56323.1 insulinase family protein [Exiguobacterium sp. SH1S21]TCI73007.1 insulinase family protein [Exiguobacterium sp. SH0S7]